VGVDPCPLCDGHPVVLVAPRHPAMRRFTRELLEREYQCWTAVEPHGGASLSAKLAALAPDLLVIDAVDLPGCCPDPSSGFPVARVVVVGPEPDPSYRQAVRAHGAATCVPRERVGEDLGREMRRVLGCIHDPCPAAEPQLISSVAEHQRRRAARRVGRLSISVRLLRRLQRPERPPCAR
jgi:DNA-binding NarL/FixJ family response regulator